MAIAERDTMRSLAKGLAVIESFSADMPRQSISDVATATGLDRATARRCLLTLAEIGYADYDGKYFTLTPRTLRLGTACLATMPLPQIVQPLIDALSDGLGESVSVSILDQDEIIYVARAAQKKVMSVTLMPGSRLPAYCTSMGRVLLAAMPVEDARTLLAARPLEARTKFTTTGIEAIMAVLADIRSRGYALVDREVELGLRSIAVPVLNSRNRTVAALNIGLPMRDEALPDIAARYLPSLWRVQAELKTIIR